MTSFFAARFIVVVRHAVGVFWLLHNTEICILCVALVCSNREDALIAVAGSSSCCAMAALRQPDEISFLHHHSSFIHCLMRSLNSMKGSPLLVATCNDVHSAVMGVLCKTVSKKPLLLVLLHLNSHLLILALIPSQSNVKLQLKLFLAAPHD